MLKFEKSFSLSFFVFVIDPLSKSPKLFHHLETFNITEHFLKILPLKNTIEQTY